MLNIEIIQRALQETTGVHGWIFTNFSHRDTLTDQLLLLNSNNISTRRWVYIIPTDGEAIKIVHAIEADMLEYLPGKTCIYSGKQELEGLLHEHANKTFALLADENISVISTVDAGFVQTLHACNIKTTSAAPLIQRTKGLLSPAGIKSHERAASLLYKIVAETWSYISNIFILETELTEYDVLTFILNKFDEYSLVFHHEPIVAFGKNAGNPHYSVTKESSAVAQKGDIIQLDIFAKEALCADDSGKISKDAAIYADISWVGVYDMVIPEQYIKAFSALCEARDIVFTTLQESSNTGKLLSVTGYELDEKVRQVLISNGYRDNIKHRTGHGIDTACHGSGVNLDSVEFPDKRTLLNGSCFSVEPGIYCDTFGMRTEIDIYIENERPVISGSFFNKQDGIPVPQKELLFIQG